MNVVLAGNPNCGKTSLFNRFTGMNQKVGNYPGITVSKREGSFKIDSEACLITDLPGIYSLYAGSEDEQIAVNALLDLQKLENPPIILCIIDIQSPHKNLLLLSQLIELGMPIIGVFNYRKKTTISEVSDWVKKLKAHYNIPFLALNANSGEGLSVLKEELKNNKNNEAGSGDPNSKVAEFAIWIKQANDSDTGSHILKITKDLRARLEDVDNSFPSKTYSPEYKPDSTQKTHSKTSYLDKLLMHHIWGYLIFGISLIVIFQAVFSWSAYPMEWIEEGFGLLSAFTHNYLPSNFYTNAISDGIIPGLAGIVVFVPQISFLFLFVALFEESGYMTRVVYLMDRLVKPFGLSGRSVVPLISGYACAIPAIMATRTIKNPRERLITMLVIPFMTCSARIPVYTTLIALMMSSEASLGIFNSQGLVLFALYLFGAFMSFFTALIAHKTMKRGGRSMLIMELPNYKIPSFNNVVLTIYEKSKSFVFQAGKIIILVSLALYLMSNIGFNDTFEKIEDNDTEFVNQFTPSELAQLKLENSMIGQLGKFIEPAIKPLGYDWKIGISLITSFAAREVFVGTMSTIYALEDAGDDTSSIVQKMQSDKNPDCTAKYSLAVVLSLLVFYALAMQCLSTIAVMYKETGGWKWPSIQFVVSTGSAYLLALLVYQLMS
jgi:ferrous iron transport protein B